MAGALAVRKLEPEILDFLEPDDRRAIGSRRDLRWINAIMFQAPTMAGLLRRNLPVPPRRILEIGAGDGSFMLAVARRVARDWPAVEVTLLDRVPLVSDATRTAFRELGWQVEVVTADVFAWLGPGEGRAFDAVTANLFLHHFDEADLGRLFTGLQALAPVVIATEPHRNPFALFATRLLFAIGVNDVTRHDARQSVLAGFRGDELSKLWPRRQGERIEDRRIGPFTQVFAVGGSR